VKTALLGSDPAAAALAAALREAGHEADVIAPAPSRLPEAVLRRRGFTGPLTHLPLSVAALARGGYEIAHAFSPPDALAARLWRRRSGGLVVYTCTEALGRERLADRRLRLALLTAALEESDAVTATGPAEAAALARWMLVDAPVVAPHEGAAYDRLYRALPARRR
jgi:hypothetical protein